MLEILAYYLIVALSFGVSTYFIYFKPILISVRDNYYNGEYLENIGFVSCTLIIALLFPAYLVIMLRPERFKANIRNTFENTADSIKDRE